MAKGSKSPGHSSVTDSRQRKKKFKPTRFLHCFLNAPKVLLTDLKELLRGRTTIQASEVEKYELWKKDKNKPFTLKKEPIIVNSNVLNVPKELITSTTTSTSSLGERKQPSSSQLMSLNVNFKVLKKPKPQLPPRPQVRINRSLQVNLKKPVALGPPRCIIEPQLVTGYFYLASQEGNRLQLMRYNGSTFEAYNWDNAYKENVLEGCLVNASQTD